VAGEFNSKIAILERRLQRDDGSWSEPAAIEVYGLNARGASVSEWRPSRADSRIQERVAIYDRCAHG
jgi:hypothetical protein